MGPEFVDGERRAAVSGVPQVSTAGNLTSRAEGAFNSIANRANVMRRPAGRRVLPVWGRSARPGKLWRRCQPHTEGGLHYAMDEFSEPELDRPRGRELTPALVAILEPAPEVRKEVAGEAVLRYYFRFSLSFECHGLDQKKRDVVSEGRKSIPAPTSALNIDSPRPSLVRAPTTGDVLDGCAILNHLVQPGKQEY